MCERNKSLIILFLSFSAKLASSHHKRLARVTPVTLCGQSLTKTSKFRTASAKHACVTCSTSDRKRTRRCTTERTCSCARATIWRGIRSQNNSSSQKSSLQPTVGPNVTTSARSEGHPELNNSHNKQPTLL